jgi:hypothetical protein
MKFRGGTRPFRFACVWIAGLAVLMAALAPVISQAVQSVAGPGWTLVCTPSGSKWLRADEPGPEGQAPAHDAAHLFEHCPYCSLHAATLGMPPISVGLPALPLTHAAHRRYIAATPTLQVWPTAQSRGPPAIG